MDDENAPIGYNKDISEDDTVGEIRDIRLNTFGLPLPSTKAVILKDGFEEGKDLKAEIIGIPCTFHCCVFRDEFKLLKIAISADKEEIDNIWNKGHRCRFLVSKMRCDLRKDMILCKARKAKGECPIEKGIPEGSTRVLWGRWLDRGGDPSISVEEFLKKHLSDVC